MQNIRAVVEREFDQVNTLIIEQLESDVDMVENIGHYIVDAGGKRLRPLLALLSAAAIGECTPRHICFAAVIEFIHTATLLHDDVVDLSELRRGRLTANAAFGNAPSVLVGDFLYTRAFQLMVSLDDMALLSQMADTTNMIAAGEVLQLARAGDASTSETQYLDVITRKTAVLFAAACRGAAQLHGDGHPHAQDLYDFGLHLGIAFQMIDDVLDYEGDPAAMGKNVGDDLTEGKPTLPLIHVISSGTGTQASLVSAAITGKRADQLEAIMQAITDCDSLGYTRRAAISHRDQALACLARLPESPARNAMQALAALSVDRSH
ncbi:polyprenyl synthetase family protein [Chromatocurvus halotolerans]|uniref:Octaprenyl diphosphate synthase n=1 Tax=Chromatocurvus halotolerans TaxID=1132028 RepID=A0A4R2KEJ5_9GAMM|nr:polyprenyl synthetase family protein [Chromatocurvus halotolerans]TCO71434.1 octaprenyl-diphosphate synthase [Chromatocurvus halotolerans]